MSASMAEQGSTDEELVEELKRLKVADVLMQSLFTVSSLAYHKLSPPTRDVEQVRLAIETMRTLLPLVEGQVDDEVVANFRQVVANLQLAYAEAAAAGDSPSE